MAKKSRFKNKRFLLGILALILCSTFFYIYILAKETKAHTLDEEYISRAVLFNSVDVPKSKEAGFKTGEKLAKIHCGSCHSYVSPTMLDRITWPRVLGIMKSEMDKKAYRVDQDEWNKVQQFYLSNSPSAFFSAAPKIRPTAQSLFSERFIKNPLNTFNNSTLLKYIAHDSTVYIGKKNGNIYSLKDDQLKEAFTIPNVPVDLKSNNRSLLVLGIGSLKPSEDRTGQLIKMNETKIEGVMVDSLKRPVHFQVVDVDRDGKEEYLISSFGSTVGKIASGKLSLFTNSSSEEIIIDSLPGAMQVEVADLDHDGTTEIIALFTQGNEAINTYKRNDKKDFSKISSILFPPVYGTNSFALADIDEDGYKDILVTNGDNDDYSKIYKAYHGVSIYLNDGNNRFTEKFFYRINGASKVKCADLDQDGDLDFIVLAMYPDLFSRPWENLLFFENVGNLNYKVQYFEEKPSANWMLMDLADIDQDGDEDLVTAANVEISSLVPPRLTKMWMKEQFALKVYYNKTKDSSK